MLCVLSTLVGRDQDGATALHMAAAVQNNLACMQLVCARLSAADFVCCNSQGLTALEVDPVQCPVCALLPPACV